MSTHDQEKENFWVIKNFVNWIRKKFDLQMKIIKSDNKLSQKWTLNWLQSQEIDFKSSAFNIQDQNNIAEYSENVIMKKTCAMWISANLSQDLWKEIINCVIYLYNQTSWKAQSWKTFYKIFYTHVKNYFTAQKKL